MQRMRFSLRCQTWLLCLHSIRSAVAGRTARFDGRFLRARLRGYWATGGDAALTWLLSFHSIRSAVAGPLGSTADSKMPVCGATGQRAVMAPCAIGLPTSADLHIQTQFIHIHAHTYMHIRTRMMYVST